MDKLVTTEMWWGNMYRMKKWNKCTLKRLMIDKVALDHINIQQLNVYT